MDDKQAIGELTQLLSMTSPGGNLPSSRHTLDSIARSVAPPVDVAETAGTVAGGEAVAGVNGEMDKLAAQLAELTRVAREQSQSTESNTQAVIENSLAQASSGKGSTAASIGKTIFSFLGGGLGLVGLLGKLFDRGGETTVAAPVSYSPPAPVSVEAGVLAGLGGAQPLRYGQSGVAVPTANTAAPQQPVTIQVQALDSRSILDHSTEIAQAVKEALLNSHSLNDVVTEI